MQKEKETKKALLVFVCGLVVILGLLECLVRHNQNIFEGASHRLLAKLAIFERKQEVNLLFFGSSRTQDGIAPRLVSRYISDIAPPPPPVSVLFRR